jgi:hypothetical protein
LRTYTGAPYSARAFSTASTARSTPAQYPRGVATRILRPSGEGADGISDGNAEAPAREAAGPFDLSVTLQA